MCEADAGEMKKLRIGDEVDVRSVRVTTYPAFGNLRSTSCSRVPHHARCADLRGKVEESSSRGMTRGTEDGERRAKDVEQGYICAAERDEIDCEPGQ